MFNRNDYFSNSVRHAEGGTVVAVRSTDRGKARSSPTQRKYFVCNYCFAGARPLDNIGAAAKFDNTGYNFSYTFNQDGSKSLNLGVNANIPIETPWVYLEINMGLGFSMNSYSGATLSTNGGLCVGEATACGGIENGGWNYGGGYWFETWRYESSTNSSSLNLLGMEVYARDDMGTFGADGFQGDYFIFDVSENLEEINPSEFSYVHHFLNGEDWIGAGAETGFYDQVDSYYDQKLKRKMIEVGGRQSIEDVAATFRDGSNGYNGNSDIRMYSCSLAKYGAASKFSTLVPNRNIWAATSDVRIFKIQFLWMKFYRPMLDPGGKWQMYRNGNLVK